MASKYLCRVLLSLAVIMSVGVNAAPMDRARFMLAPGLARAELVFTGTVTDDAVGAHAVVIEPLKGTLTKGQKLNGKLEPVEYAVAKAPKGTVLVVVTGGEFATFALTSFPAKFAKATLAVLDGNPSVSAFKLKSASPETTRELFEQVFGHEVISVPAREAAMREVLARATPEWESVFLSLPEALALPSLVPAFVEYFQKFPREKFSSAARWNVFTALRSRESMPFLLTELDSLRLDEDLNVAHYVFDALAASDAAGARCAFQNVLAEGGLWLSRDDQDPELRRRIAALPSAKCPEVRKATVPMPTDLRGIRRIAFKSSDPSQALALVKWSQQQKDPAFAEAALRAAGRIGQRVEVKGLPEALAKEFASQGAPIKHGASAGLTRVVQHEPALLDWLMAQPVDLIASVVAQLDFSDAEFAKAVLTRVKPGTPLHTLAKAQPELLKKFISDVLRTDPLKALQLAGRAGIDSIPLEDVARLAKQPELRSAALLTMHNHLVGSEQYARGVPYFSLMLESLADDDEKVRGAALLLVDQLALKGQYAPYKTQTPELNSLVPSLLELAKTAQGERRARFLKAARGMQSQVFSAEQRRTLDAL